MEEKEREVRASRKRKHNEKEAQKREEEIKKRKIEEIETVSNMLTEVNLGERSLKDILPTIKEYLNVKDSDLLPSGDKGEINLILERIHQGLSVNHGLLEKPSFAPSDVIKRSSVLGGIYFSNEPTDWVISRSPIVDLVGNVFFKVPCQSETEHSVYFYTSKEKNEFDRTLEKRGYDFAAKLCIGTIIKQGIAGGLRYESDMETMEEQKTVTTKTTLNKTLYAVVPVVLWEPTMQNITLAKEAKTELKHISSLLSINATEKAKPIVIKFFDKFGSHFYLGKNHFGGTFKIETTYEGNAKESKKHMKEVVEYHHSGAIKAAFNLFSIVSVAGEVSGQEKHEKGKAKHIDEKAEDTKVTNTITKIGGPLEVNSVPLWKKGLIENNSTWVVVSSGEPEICQDKLQNKDYIGVWELVIHEVSYFGSKTLKLSRFLVETWQDKTGLKADTTFLDLFEIQQNEKKIKGFIKRIKYQIRTKPHAEILKDLCDVVAEMKKVSGCQNIWEKEICTNEVILNLFKAITKPALDESQDYDVRYQMDTLLGLTNVETFPWKKEILFWLRNTSDARDIQTISSQKIKSVEMFLTCLEGPYLRKKRLSLDKCTGDKNKERKVLQTMTAEVALSIVELLKYFQEGSYHVMYVFFLSPILQIDFDIKEHAFGSLLTIERLTDFLEYSKYGLQLYHQSREQGSLANEAFVWHQLLKTVLQKTGDKESEAQQLYDKIYDHINNIDINAKLQQQIRTILKKNISISLPSLDNIIHGKSINRRPVIMWNFFEKRSAFSQNENIPNANAESLSTIGKEVLHLLDLIGLTHYYPGKLSIKNILSLDHMSSVHQKDEGEIAWIMLRKVMSVDFNFREQVLENFINNFTQNANDNFDSDFDDDDLFVTTNSFRRKDQPHGQWEILNPLDVFLAIFQCCDPFLKQIIVQKISVCQLAVPYLYTDFIRNQLVLSLFPLREVFYDSRSESVATSSLKTVSFIRVGSGIAKSKSKIVNELLRNNNEEHSTFFHRDCPRGMTKRTISNGLVEASWYVPRQDSISQDQILQNKQIPEPITVLNLRGNAAEFVEQIDTLIMTSNIIIIFIKYEDLRDDKHISILEKIHKSSCSVLLLTDVTKRNIECDDFIQSYRNKIGNSRTKLISTFDMKQEREMNADELKNLLRRNVITQLKNIEQGIILEKVVIDNSILTDETIICGQMQRKAKLLYQQIQTTTEASVCRKQHFTPLQCEDLWQKWSARQKEQKRQTNQRQYDTEETLLREMNTLRMKQVEACNSMPNVIAEFVQNLLDFIDDNDTINYFLFFFRHYLDNDSKIIIPKLQEEFRRAFEKYQSEKVKTSDLKRHIDEIEKKLARASFGLEHFFREIGQIYEAFVYCKEELDYTISYKTWCIIQKLPLTIAKLLVLLGQPLELMDGDAANVPLIWIKAVFDQLKQILHNGKLLSISVLGIQSSGKSTLLNTMFGLRFAVSAGRCTRGLYAQIIPVGKENSSLDFDYALVIDTEGLRTPELASDKINHDNELATLVIGLTDTVLINIKGETIADMENVLQIVVHGLLRLKQANKNLQLHHRCIFVHQNVSAEDARIQMLQGNKNTMERLDKMTKEVAVQEGIPEISCFKDVIEFDPTKDVRFLPDLWNGTRPMAPASTIYSSKAVDTRKSIVEYAATGKTVFMNVENKRLHLQSLWNGILNENFVFSFRNCLEVKAYSLLESEFQSLLSTLDFDKLQWMAENIKPRLCKQNTNEQLDLEAARLKNDFRENIKQKGTDAEERLITFINKSELSDIMITWKAHKLQYLFCLTDTMVQDVEKKIRHEIQQKLFSLSTNDLLTKKKRQINLKAKEVAMSFKDKKLKKCDIIEQFQNLWISWINELIPETAEETVDTKERKLEEDIKIVLHEKFGDQKHLITKGFKEISLGIAPNLVRGQLKNSVKELRNGNTKPYSVMTQVKFWKSPPKQPLLDTINGIFTDIDDMFESLFRQETEYEISQLRQIVDKIRIGFKTFNAKNEFGYLFTPKFEVFIALHVARHSYKQFKALNRKYEKEHGLRNRLQRYKPQAQQLFIDICQAKSEEMIATNVICTSLQALVKERVERNLPLDIQREIVNMYVSQKRIIMKNILEDLAEKNDFQTFTEYIKCPDKYVRRWIKKRTDDIIFYTKTENKSKYQIWTENDIDFLIRNLIDAVRFSSDKCSKDEEEDVSIDYWIHTLIGQVESLNLLIEKDTFQQETEFTISSFSEFSVNIVKELNNKVKTNLKENFRSQSPEKITWPGENPYDNIFDALWGCTEKCPFCGEPCQKSMKNHGSEHDCHTCIQHRPSGINGCNWKRSEKLAIETCSFDVQSGNAKYCGKWCSCPNKKTCENSHPYKDYKSYYPEWDIAPSSDNSSSAYWMWFLKSHKENLAKYYQTELPDIPESWNNITKKKAIKSLADLYET